MAPGPLLLHALAATLISGGTALADGRPQATGRPQGPLQVPRTAARAPRPPPSKPRSSLRWLSFYNDCDWGTPNTTAAATPFAASPSADASDVRAPGGVDGFVGLPLVEGSCLPKGPYDRGMCWLDQLTTANRHNSSAMLILQTSGPVYCGRAGCEGCKYLCPDSCDDPALRPHPGGDHPSHNWSDQLLRPARYVVHLSPSPPALLLWHVFQQGEVRLRF